jgi:hypothetical protein
MLKIITRRHVREYPVILDFPMPRVGWEMDNTGYVVLDGDKRRLVFTSHGTPYFATAENAAEMLTLYSEAEAGLTHAINLTKENVIEMVRI